MPPDPLKIQKSQNHEWPPGHVVVSQTVCAGASTIIISSEAGAAIDLAAKATVGAGVTTLAGLNADLSVKSQRKIGAQFVSAAGLTPLVQTVGIRKRFLRPAELRAARQPEEFEVERVYYDQVLA